MPGLQVGRCCQMQGFVDNVRSLWNDHVEAWESVTELLTGYHCTASHCSLQRAEPMELGVSADPGARDEKYKAATQLQDAERQILTLDSTPRPRAWPTEKRLSEPRAPESARSTQSAASETDMPHEEREKEKTRLQRMLKEFAKEVVAGIPVNLVNSHHPGLVAPCVLQMDKHLQMFSLRLKDGSVADSTSLDFRMADVDSVFKGQEVARRAAFLGSNVAGCVGMNVIPPERSFILYFDDAYERDRFYTSMQVLVLSVGIQMSR
eukprot:TRINITY_DN61040_c0_g1_i1.p1 TRINITY_DN61040_c0_g1~~TRINITY_DN61040_c0_g1_i1.p1  ORF type:complete len:264 (+),score=53.70 TRINITY_DN61040_c0_g1_i1:49-840(+)